MPSRVLFFALFASLAACRSSAAVAPDPAPSEGARSNESLLSPEQIRDVVSRERSGVTLCWQAAARQTGRSPHLRVDVDLLVDELGVVTRTNGRGEPFGDILQCLERTLALWRFPAAGGESRLSIPFVFYGGD